MSENGEIYTADKNFTLPPAVTAVTNSTSEDTLRDFCEHLISIIVLLLTLGIISHPPLSWTRKVLLRLSSLFLL